MKKCLRCGIEKPLEEFHRKKSAKDGYGKWCKECQNSYYKEYYQRNRERILKHVTEYTLKREKTDIEFLLLRRYRARLYKAIKGLAKPETTRDLIGCTGPELMEHLEKQFVPGMTWDNYGAVWHVDHIRPCSSFDFSNDDEIRACFHYTNLQPLFAEENLKKSNKLNWR